VNSLAICLFLLVKKRVLVFRKHLLFAGHFAVPPFDGFGGLSGSVKGGADGIDDAVNGPQTLSLTGLLWLGDAPWDLPVWREGMVSEGVSG
jgi:hypothetical protein